MFWPVSKKQRIVLSGYSAELLQLCKKNHIKIVGVADPNIKNIPTKLLTFNNDIEAIETLKPDAVLNGIDNMEKRVNAAKIYNDKNIRFQSLIAGEICDTSTFKNGLIVQKNAFISENCELGFCIKINTSAIITHDVKIDDFSIIAPGAVVLGRVKIGKRVYIGANATILPDISVGDDCTIGAGAVVTKDVKKGTTVVGSPACKIQKYK